MEEELKKALEESKKNAGIGSFGIEEEQNQYPPGVKQVKWSIFFY